LLFSSLITLSCFSYRFIICWLHQVCIKATPAPWTDFWGTSSGPAEIYREPRQKSCCIHTEPHMFGENSHPSIQGKAIIAAKLRDFKAFAAL